MFLVHQGKGTIPRPFSIVLADQEDFLADIYLEIG